MELYNNKITSLDAGVFGLLKNLDNLGLANNGISELKNGVFSGLNSLETLGVEENKITTIEAGVFLDIPSLNYLFLGKNEMRSFKPGTFGNIKHISIKQNLLTNVHREWFESSPIIMDLYDNPVRCDCNLYGNLKAFNGTIFDRLKCRSPFEMVDKGANDILRYNPLNCTVCDHQPCKHDSTCKPLDESYHCECSKGYSGKNCEKGSTASDLSSPSYIVLIILVLVALIVE